MQKPSQINTIGALFLAGGIISVFVCLALTVGSFLIWFPAYTYGLVAAIFAIGTGARLLGNNAYGSGVPKATAIMMIVQIINCDGFSLFFGIFILTMLSQPEVTAYLTGGQALAGPGGQATAIPAPPPGVPANLGLGQGSLIRVRTSYLPIAWLLSTVTPQILINNVISPRPWGTHSFEVAPGRYFIEIYFAYWPVPKSGHATLVVDVPPGHVVDIDYAKNNPLMGANGTIKVVAVQPLC